MNQYSYDPYGNTTSSSGSALDYFGFQGGFRAPASLTHFGDRYENPSDARWTQQDPLQQINSLTQNDRYSFAGDDPTNNSDPDGEMASLATYGEKCAGGAVTGAIAGAANPAGSALSGAGIGCAEGVVSQAAADFISPAAGTAADVLFGAHDVYETGAAAVESYGSALATDIGSLFS